MYTKDRKKKKAYVVFLAIFISLGIASCDKSGTFRKTIINGSQHDVSLITNRKDGQGTIISTDTVTITKQKSYTLYEKEGFDYATLNCDLFRDDSLSLIVTNSPSLKVDIDLNLEAVWQKKSSNRFQECYVSIADSDIKNK